MNWTAPIDAYCERTDPSLWSEPINAITNLAFVIAAIWIWPRLRGLPGAKILAVILFSIGIGSGLNHTFAVGWASAADSLSILVFILVYLFLASRDFLGLRAIWALVATLAFFPYAALSVPLFSQISWLGSSAAYAPVALLIAIYALVLRKTAPKTAIGMGLGALMLTVSILVRSMDLPLCTHLPLGTHFLWHILNATMLCWMIEIYRRHMLAGAPHKG